MKIILLLLFLTIPVSSESQKKSSDDQKFSGNTVAFFKHRFPYSVTLKIILYYNKIKVKMSRKDELLIAQDFAADFCYLAFFSQKKGGEYSKTILNKMVVGYRENFLPKEDYFQEGKRMKLVSPADPKILQEYIPFDIMEKIVIPENEYKSIILWYYQNGYQKNKQGIEQE